MGREAHILLSILGLLAGAFVGILSMKLLSPRPPAGAGVDIHDAVAAATPTDIVEPPPLSLPSVPRPIVDDAPDGNAATLPAAAGMVASAAPRPIDVEAIEAAVPVVAAEEPDAAPRRPPVTAATVADIEPVSRIEFAPAGALAVAAAPATPAAPRHEVTRHVAAAGDSWWSLAERIYGDGRFYRALFAWNRAVNPRVSLVPGTPLELPPLSKLATAWPDLVPGESPEGHAAAVP